MIKVFGFVVSDNLYCDINEDLRNSLPEQNIIYAAECVRHKKIYIGQSKNQLNKRFCGHR